MDQLAIVRRDVVARLCQAQAAGFISVETFEDRYALVRQATSTASLEALVADLVEEADPVYPLIEPVESTGLMTASAAVPVAPAESIRVSAVFGSAVRAGTWTVPEQLELLVAFGEAKLDFRDATFTTDTIFVDISVTLGSLTLIVPPGTQVENECHEMFSSSSHPHRGRKGAPPNGLLIIIRGKLRLGEISIKERVPTADEKPMLKPLLDKLLRRPSE